MNWVAKESSNTPFLELEKNEEETRKKERKERKERKKPTPRSPIGRSFSQILATKLYEYMKITKNNNLSILLYFWFPT